MKKMVAIFAVMAMNLNAFAQNEIVSQNKLDPNFIKVSYLFNDEFVRFELCETANPEKCTRIGSRDYKVSELESQKLFTIGDAVASGIVDTALTAAAVVFLVKAGAIIGAGTAAGVAGGGATGYALINRMIGYFAVRIGPFAGKVVGGTVGIGSGAIISLLVNHPLNPLKYVKQANTLENSLKTNSGDVVIKGSVAEFAAQLSTILAELS